MKKRVLVSLLLAAALLLSGCSLVVKDQKVDNARVIVQVNDETVNKETFMQYYNAALENQKMMEQLYRNYGMQVPAVSQEDTLNQTVRATVRRLVLEQKAKELGLDILSDEEKKSAEDKAQVQYDGQLSSIQKQFFAGTQLEGDALKAALKEKADELGLDLELLKDEARKTAVLEKVRQDAIKDVTVTAEEIQKEFDTRVENDKKKFTEDANAYGKALNGGNTVYYAPAGYRMVKQVLIKFTADDQKAIGDARNALTPLTQTVTKAESALDENGKALAKEGLSADELQKLTDQKGELQKALDEAKAKEQVAQQNLTAALEKGYAAIAQKAQDVYTKAQGDENFDELIKTFNEDPGQPEQGYAVREGFSDFDEAFVKPAMALAEKGSVAEPSKGQYGYYIVQYADDVAEGAVSLSSVSDTIKGDLLKKRQNETFEKTVQQWIDAAKVETFADRVKD